MKILICLPVYNRKDITELVIENLNKYKQDATFWIFNDWSEQYDNDFLEPHCDKVFKLPKSDKEVIKNMKNRNGMGVQHLRWHQFREFVNMDDYDLVYFTDSDALHDPSYIDVLKSVHEKYTLKSKDGTQKIKIPVCLYSTKWHLDSTVKEGKDVYIRKTAPGISQLYTKDMANKIVEVLDNQPSDPDYAWDYRCLEYLGLPVVTTKTSYVEHFGADTDSMHTPKGEWDRDRALNPTKYLEELRQPIIDYLEGRAEKPIV